MISTGIGPWTSRRLARIGSYLNPNYYIDSDNGLDTNDGLTADTAWKTIDKINSNTFESGDVIGIKRGSVFHETLIVPNYDLTFISYGSGTTPIIEGTDIITGWQADPPSWQTGFDPTYSSAMGPSVNFNVRNVILPNTTISGTKIRISITCTGGSGVVTGASIGEMTTNADFDVAPTRITFGGGSSGISISSGETIISDEMDYIYDGTKRHGLHLFLANGQYFSFNNSAVNQRYSFSSTSDMTLTQTPGGFSAFDTGLLAFDLLEISGEAVDVYNVNANVIYPNMLFKDGILQINAESKGSLQDNEWYHDSGVLSYKSISGNPDTLGDKIEATIRPYCLTTNKKSNIKISDSIKCSYKGYERFADNFIYQVFDQVAEVAALVSPDGNRLDVWGTSKKYFYSYDGLTFTGPINMVMNTTKNVACGYMVIHNGSYFFYCRLDGDGYNAIHLFTGTDRINFTDQGAMIEKGISPDFDWMGVHNMMVWNEGDNWYMIYEGGGQFKLGLATANSPNGPWTKYAGNPILEYGSDMAGGPAMMLINNDILKYDSKYWLYYHGGEGLVTRRAYSSDLHSWVKEGAVFVNGASTGGTTEAWEGWGDPCLIQFKGKSYLFWSDSDQMGLFHTNMAVDNRTMAEILPLSP